MEHVMATSGMVSAIYNVLYMVYVKQYPKGVVDFFCQHYRKEHILDASLPTEFLYEHSNYKTVEHGIYELENDVKLVYEVIEKNFKISWFQRI